jgi:hypothetical protein
MKFIFTAAIFLMSLSGFCIEENASIKTYRQEANEIRSELRNFLRHKDNRKILKSALNGKVSSELFEDRLDDHFKTNFKFFYSNKMSHDTYGLGVFNISFGKNMDDFYGGIGPSIGFAHSKEVIACLIDHEWGPNSLSIGVSSMVVVGGGLLVGAYAGEAGVCLRLGIAYSLYVGATAELLNL